MPGFRNSLVLILLAAVVAQGAPVIPTGKAVCIDPRQRKPWHTLVDEEKVAYIKAEKCLMSKPARLGLSPAARTGFDEFQMIHILQTPEVHFVGAFLPFHRLYVHAHEYVLATECNYTGAQPYWDESLDADDWESSVLFDPDTGFGGNGVGLSKCIADGPFKNYVNAVGPGQSQTDHCIDRDINMCMGKFAAPNIIENCMKMENFSTFWPCIENGPHGAGHGGVGGEMLNLFSSPGDPLFYLHHAYLDKLWAEWQAKNTSTRFVDITGRNTGLPFGFGPGFNGSTPPVGPIPGGQNGTLPPFNGSVPGFPSPVNGTCPDFGPFTMSLEGVNLMKRDGDPGNVTTLTHVLSVNGMLPNVTVADVMDTQGGLLCYEYV